MAQAAVEPAWTWKGIAEHMSGVKNFSGRNGLATFRYAKPEQDLIAASISFRERFYGSTSTGVSSSISAKVAKAGPGEVSVGAKIGGIEGNITAKGSFSLLDLFKLARQITEKVQQLGPLKQVIEQMMKKLPDISISGEVAVYVGMTSSNVWYLRLQTGAGASFKVPGVSLIKGAGFAMGRSWQIQLQHWWAHWPKAFSY